jgi:hypothetical protein
MNSLVGLGQPLVDRTRASLGLPRLVPRAASTERLSQPSRIEFEGFQPWDAVNTICPRRWCLLADALV